MARAIYVGGRVPLDAAAALGLTPKQGRRLMESDAFHAEREVIQSTKEANRDSSLHSIESRLWSMAPEAVEKTRNLMLESEDDAVALRACNSVLDRVGARAPERSIATHDIELSDATIALIAKAFDAVKILNAIDLERDFGFALQRPEMDDERAMKKIGTASNAAPNVTRSD